MAIETFEFETNNTGRTGTIQQWTVPVNGLYRITAVGAQGGGVYSARGAKMIGNFELLEGEKLHILVGQNGSGYAGYSGGGGTFVTMSDNTPLIIAGGSGGCNSASYSSYSRPSVTENAMRGSIFEGGIDGNGGGGSYQTGGGGGLLSDGGGNSLAGKSYLNGAYGGSSDFDGGFGGGGAGYYYQAGANRTYGFGGGGGYSGGGGGNSSSQNNGAGGGGGSFNSGMEQVNEVSSSARGYVTIDLLEILEPPGTHHEVDVMSYINSLSSNINPKKERVANTVCNMDKVNTTAVLGRLYTPELISLMQPIESASELTSMIAAKYIETRAGPFTTSSLQTSKATKITTSSVARIKTGLQRGAQRSDITVTQMEKGSTNVIRQSVAAPIVLSGTKFITSDVISATLRLKGLRLINAPLGTVIKDSETQYNGQPIEWIVIAQDHPGYPAGSTTLLARYALSFKPYSGAESGVAGEGSIYDYSQRYGDSGWRSSDIRVWLNQKEKLGRPVQEAVYNNEYADEPGFLNGFANRFMEQIKSTSIETTTNDRDSNTNELIYVTTQDKIFFLSRQEIGLNGTDEGFPLAEEISEQIRIAYPTQEAIDTDDSGATRYKEDPTGWYTRSSNKQITDRVIVRDILYVRPGYSNVSADPIKPNMGTVAIRPALNIRDDIYLSDEPDNDGVYTLIYDPIYPNIKQETVTVTSFVNPINVKTSRTKNEERLSSTGLKPIGVNSSLKSSGERDTTTTILPFTHSTTTKQQKAFVVSAKLTSISTANSSIKKCITANVSYLNKVVMNVYGEKAELERISTSYIKKINWHNEAIPANRTTAIVTSQTKEVTSFASTLMKWSLEAVSRMDRITSNISIETIAAGQETFIVSSRVKPISSNNKRSVNKNVTSVSHLPAIRLNATRDALANTTVSSYTCPVKSLPIANPLRVVVARSYVKLFYTYTVTKENDGKSVRSSGSYVSRMHSNVEASYKGPNPTIKLSHFEYHVKLTMV